MVIILSLKLKLFTILEVKWLLNLWMLFSEELDSVSLTEMPFRIVYLELLNFSEMNSDGTKNRDNNNLNNLNKLY